MDRSDTRLPSRTRLAPTPSGLLHWGNALSFVLTWLTARQSGAKILLRIDDLDSERKRPEYVEDIFRSLDWLGIDFDEGPIGPDDFEMKFSQRHRMDLYTEGLHQLCEYGRVFVCDCSRSMIQATGDGRHPQACRQAARRPSDSQGAWRLNTEGSSQRWTDFDQQERSVCVDTVMRDFVVRRKDGIPAYQLASVVDDAHFGVDLVVRGMDLIESTAAQRWLAGMLDSSAFEQSRFLHHPIVKDPDGNKLSKSSGAESLETMRKSDPTAKHLYRRLSPLLGLNAEVDSIEMARQLWESHD